ncbi:MAG: AAA family ATPase [Firmicutes bacterium]|nr:AAA family ATPase [Candidatus Colimorpha enterica]
MTEQMNENNQFELYFEIHSLLRDLIRNIWVYFLAALIGCMGYYVYYSTTRQPIYKSSAYVCVNASTNSTASIRASKTMTQIFGNIFRQNLSKKLVAEHLGNDEFDGTVSVSVEPETNFMTVTVRSSTRENSFNQLKTLLEIYPQITDNIFSSAVVTVIKPPSMAGAAENLMGRRMIALSGLAGAFLAVAITVFLSLIRPTVKDEQSFKKMIKSKLIGTIPHEDKFRGFSLSRLLGRGRNKQKQKQKQGLLIAGNNKVHLAFAESIRKIAANVEYNIKKDGSCRTIAVTSVYANEGKTTSVANLAIALAERGNRVYLIDMDFKKPSIHLIFDLLRPEENSFVTDENTTIADFRFYGYSGLPLHIGVYEDAINRQRHKSGENKKARLSELISEVGGKADFILIDMAPMSVDSTTTDIISVSDQTILLTRTDSSYGAAINDAIKNIKDVGGNFAGCILNDVFGGLQMLGESDKTENAYALASDDKKFADYRKDSDRKVKNAADNIKESGEN